MKTLLFFLLLPLSLMGQEKPDSMLLIKIDSTVTYPIYWASDSAMSVRKLQLDTVEVWINCAEMENRGLIAYNISLKGWEVRTPKWVPAHWDENDAYISGYWKIEKTYLNHFKQPLTGYIVWATKEVKK